MSNAPKINVNRWQMACRWMFGLNGAFNPDLTNEIRPVVSLENDRFEQRIGRGELTFAGVGSAGALAGNIGQVGLFIPPNSGIVVTIEEIEAFQVNSVFNLRRLYSNGPHAGAGTGIGVDTRMGSSTVPACQIVSTLNAAQLGTQFHTQPARGATINGKYSREIAMAASQTGGVVIWYDVNVANLAIDCNFRWRERPLESGFLS